MAKKYLSVNLTGAVETHVRAESKRLNISHSAYVAMTLSQVMLRQDAAHSGVGCFNPKQVKPVYAPHPTASQSNLRLEDLGAL